MAWCILCTRIWFTVKHLWYSFRRWWLHLCDLIRNVQPAAPCTCWGHCSVIPVANGQLHQSYQSNSDSFRWSCTSQACCIYEALILVHQGLISKVSVWLVANGAVTQHIKQWLISQHSRERRMNSKILIVVSIDECFFREDKLKNHLEIQGVH